jgi:hypothetical protein
MLPPRSLGRFFLLSLAIFLALAALRVPLDRAYACLFRGAGNVLFTGFWFWPDGKVRFVDLHAPDQISQINELIPGELPAGYRPLRPEGVKDTLMVLMNRRAPGSIGQLRTSSRSAYWPTAMLIALVLATPLSWSRRGWALLWGLLLTHVFVALRLTLTLAAGGFAVPDKAYALFHPGAFWQRVLTGGQNVLSDNPTVSFVVPVFIWFLVALPGVTRRETGVKKARTSEGTS